MLIGQYKSKLTEKNRILVPKKIREELGDEMIIARWYEGCLVLVSSLSWQKLIKRLVGETKMIISNVREIDRFILASAFEVNLDSQGRFVLPEVLLGYSGIKEDVVFLGLGDRVEIWSLEKWLDFEKEAEKKAYLALEKIAKEEKFKKDVLSSKNKETA